MENNIEKNNPANEPEPVAENTESPISGEKKPFPLWIPILGVIAVLIIAAVIVIILTLGGSNNGIQGGASGNADYSVTVLDEIGNPMSDVIVKFTDENGKTKIKATGTDGKALLSNAEKGDYTVLIEAGPSTATVLESDYLLTAEQTELVVYVRDNSKTVELMGAAEEGSYGYYVSKGSFSVYTEQGKMTYLVLKPSQSGFYNITITDPQTNATVGYYGPPDDIGITSLPVAEMYDNGISLVIADSAKECVLGISDPTGEGVSIEITRIGDAPTELFGVVDDGAYAYSMNIGDHLLEGNAGKRKFVVFTPEEKGVYKISFTSDDEGMIIGYYGIPLFVQSNHCDDGEYDGKTFELTVRDINTPFVIGLDFTADTTATVTIERIGDPPFDPAYDAIWIYVEASGEIEQCTIPSGAVLKDLDIADSTLSVYLGDDGYYYTSDGKLVYLRIGCVGEAGYLSDSLAYIAGFVDENQSSFICGYVYDENGEFVAKYRYNNMLKSYYEKCDKGVYPLTEELAEMIKVHGESSGWWSSLFNNTAVYEPNMWLFLCCTAE